MVSLRYSPPLPLSRFVACFWYSQGFDGIHQRERLLPNGESSIVFDLREQPLRNRDPQADTTRESQAQAVFCGARTDCFVIGTSEQERVIGIQFKPGGAFPFLGVPASAVAHATHDLDDVWPRQAALLREQLLASKSVSAMFLLLEQTLLSRFNKWATRSSGLLHPAVAFSIHKLQTPAASLRIADLSETDRAKPSPAHPAFRAPDRPNPKSLSTSSAIPPCSSNNPLQFSRAVLGKLCSELRLLRSSSLHSRFQAFLWIDTGCVH